MLSYRLTKNIGNLYKYSNVFRALSQMAKNTITVTVSKLLETNEGSFKKSYTISIEDSNPSFGSFYTIGGKVASVIAAINPNYECSQSNEYSPPATIVGDTGDTTSS